MLALFGLHQAALALGVRLFWADAWLDDLLCLPLILSVVLAVHRGLRVRDDRFVLPGIHVTAAWLLITIAFELGLPVVDVAYTADPLDAVAYGAGALFFLVAINRPGAAVPMAWGDGHEA